MTVCLLSLVGIPPFAGFISKFLLFYGTLQAGLSGDTWIIALVIAGVLNSALSLYYYLKVIRFMYLYDAVDSKNIEFSNAVRYISFLTVLFLAIILPLFWQSLFEICKEATVALMA
jgi:NADH-quinone oxidoreductase subunit N